MTASPRSGEPCCTRGWRTGSTSTERRCRRSTSCSAITWSARCCCAATRLLERALALAPDTDRPAFLVALADALYNDGELRRAVTAARDAVALARAAGDRRTTARAQLVELRITRGHLEGDLDVASAEAAVRPLLAEFEALGDDEGLASALRFMGYLTMERYEEATGYLERALVHAERAGDGLNVAWAAGTLGLIAVYGPLPVADGIARGRALRGRLVGRRATTAALQRFEAVLVAMRGDIDRARALHDKADRFVEDLGSRTTVANAVFTRANLELLAGARARGEGGARVLGGL